MKLKIVSVNVGQPREVEWKGGTLTTAIYKEPVVGPVAVGQLNLAGDAQADLSVHGGPTKAVYGYPSEHYAFWREELPDVDLPWGMFGENITTAGLTEDEMQIGDQFRVGTVDLVATEPRMPCSKLSARFDRSDMVKRFLRSERTGFYFAVAREGHFEAGDSVQVLARAEHGVTMADITRLYSTQRDNVPLLRRAIAVEALDESWRGYFRHRLEKLEG